MKDNTKIQRLGGKIAVNDILVLITKQLIFALFGFFTTRAPVFGGLLPFGISVVGGSVLKYCAAATLGALIGYILPTGEILTFRYMAAALGITAIKLLISGVSKENKKPIISALIVFAVVFSVGVVTVKKDVYDMLTALTEALLAAGGAYFIKVSVLSLSRDEISLSVEELSAVLISVSLLLSGFFGISVLGISIGRILSIALILSAARFGSIAIGTICGVAFGFASLLCGGDSTAIILFSFGGMLSGVFSRLGKYAVIISFMISAFISVAFTYNEFSVIYIIEACVGAVIFLLIPKAFGIKIGKILSPAPETEVPVGLKKSVKMRLGFAANALGDVSQTVEHVAVELSKINAPDFDGVVKGVERDACRGCTLRIHCWEAKKRETTDAVIEMTRAVKNGEYMPQSFAPDEFKGRCLRLDSVGNSLFKNYTDYASRIAAENRLDEVRSVVTDQFEGISEMLNDLCREIDADEGFDNTSAEMVAAALKNIDVRPSECSCKIDKYGRMTVEIRLTDTRDVVINRIHIMRQVSVACDRDFDAPVVTKIGNETLITISERPVLRADIGVSQIACSKHSMCGDAYNYFLDGKGRAVMVLSDGMGTGGRAAVDGAMASGLIGRLIKAGFGYDCSLRILNSSMLFKSTDESLATVDISVIDLFSGKTELLKAGAAPTLVRRSGRTGKAQSSSLPVGILRDIGFDKATIRLKKGDILLMLSDGAVSEGTEWICAELEAWGDGDAKELSEHIAMCAKRRREDNHEDDITVMAAIIEKNSQAF